jgi:hypothetical protein
VVVIFHCYVPFVFRGTSPEWVAIEQPREWGLDLGNRSTLGSVLAAPVIATAEQRGASRTHIPELAHSAMDPSGETRCSSHPAYDSGHVLSANTPGRTESSWRVENLIAPMVTAIPKLRKD